MSSLTTPYTIGYVKYQVNRFIISVVVFLALLRCISSGVGGQIMNLKTIAELAGVSVATVSNVVNGNYHKVSEDTRKRIEKIIKETDYRPNMVARSLVMKESRMIGLVVPYLDQETDFLQNPYQAHIIAALEQYVRRRDYYLLLRCVKDPGDILPFLSAWNVDGAIFLGVFEGEVRQIRDGLVAPKVFIDTYAPDVDIVNVGVDDYKGGYFSARYLIGKGHRRIALATPEYDQPGVINERFKGFSDACREAGVDFDEKNIIKVDTIYKEAVAAGQNLALGGEDYTAIAAMSDVVAMGLGEGLTQCGVRVPDDISVIGFDNIPEGDLMTPKLTTIEQDYRKKAERAAEYLFRMIDGEKDLVVNESLSIRLKERQSVKTIQ